MRDIIMRGKKLSFEERTGFFSDWITQRIRHGDSMHLRVATSAADREVEVLDRYTGRPRRMLMFGSNNYLGLAGHPYVRERMKRAIDEFGAGVGGPPILNGYTALHRELEERLSAFKKQEDTVLFHSGYGANVGMVSALTDQTDTVLFDAYSHASFYDGLKMTKARSLRFAHNDVDELERLLEAAGPSGEGDVFVGVEGAYSMDGDVAPLDRIVSLCKQHEAILMIDDAHGTGVTGPEGRGTPARFGVSGEADVSWGTFSKTFGMTGGFVSTSKPVANYLRFFARSYVFSASLPPPVCAAVLAGLDLIENDPSLHERLWANIRYATSRLREIGFDLPEPETAILPLVAPTSMNLRQAAKHFHKHGIFLNTIEYPAVPLHAQRFRISLMASHTRADIDRLVACIEEVWDRYAVSEESEKEAAPSSPS